MGYRNVIVGTDGSETASLAVREAAELARVFGARLTIVTAFASHPGAVARAQEEAPDEIRWRITDAGAAEEKVASARAAAEAAGVRDVRCRTEHGDPADVLIRTADATGGDLIVVGSKGMSSATRFLLGNVPNKISHHAPCDVLIVHTAD